MKNGLMVARFLEADPRVEKVIHPGEAATVQFNSISIRIQFDFDFDSISIFIRLRFNFDFDFDFNLISI